MDEAKIIGERIRSLRKKLGLKQAELGRRVGFKATTSMMRLEKGESKPSANTLRALASELGVSMEELSEGAPERFNGAEPTEDERAVVLETVGAEASDGRKYELLMALRRAEQRRRCRAGEPPSGDGPTNSPSTKPPPEPPPAVGARRRTTRRVG